METQSVRSGRSASPDSGLTCPVCESARLVQRHCKTLCERCGYVESCEDNFLPTSDNPRR